MPALQYLALGDSYTIGESVPIEDTYAFQTAALLRAQEIPVGDPHIIAVTGWTTRDLIGALDRLPPNGVWDIVTLLIGVNNQYQGRSIEEYAREFAELLTRSVRMAGQRAQRVVVLSIPDYSLVPFSEGRDRKAIAEAIDAFNGTAKQMVIGQGSHWLDITGISRKVPGNSALVAEDGLHYSGKEYALWAKELAPVIARSVRGA